MKISEIIADPVRLSQEIMQHNSAYRVYQAYSLMKEETSNFQLEVAKYMPQDFRIIFVEKYITDLSHIKQIIPPLTQTMQMLNEMINYLSN